MERERHETREVMVEGRALRLARRFELAHSWLGAELPARQLRASWLKLGEDDVPMNPRLVGKPGVGKTTLAVAVAQGLGLPVYLMQGTADTRPEDLLITPVLTGAREMSYVASPLVTAMLEGGVCVLDEGNRMSEKSWASLASLLDHRRYVDSITAGIRIHAHAEFRFVTTMNDDSSVYDLPEYIQSRLSPQILVDPADLATETRILRHALPHSDGSLLAQLLSFLAAAHEFGEEYSLRDAIQVGRYALKRRQAALEGEGLGAIFEEAVLVTLGERAVAYAPADGDEPTPGARPGPRPLR